MEFGNARVAVFADWGFAMGNVPSWMIEVSNPSPYSRSDYVEVDMKALGVPAQYGSDNLKLFRVDEGGGQWDEIPYQIDCVLGRQVGGGQNRVLTFLSKDTPAGKDDHYRVKSACFVLEEGQPRDFSGSRQEEALWVGHYYEDRREGESADGFGRGWDPGRQAYGVKLGSDRLEMFFSLVASPREYTAIDYTGAITSLCLEDATNATGAGEMLAPYHNAPEKRWGQITDVAFFPLPWESRWFKKVSLLGKRYELVWSNSGTMRATVTVRSEPFDVEYCTEGIVEPPEIKLCCRLYRTISLNPAKPFVTEDVYVLTEEGKSVSFRPYYYANLCYPTGVPTELKRFEHIPDYLAIWKQFGEQYRGLGFASDTHIRAIDFSECEPRWRLQLGHLKRCIHYCMFFGFPASPGDPFHDVGHYAWYERVFKPLRAIPCGEFATTRQYAFGWCS